MVSEVHLTCIESSFVHVAPVLRMLCISIIVLYLLSHPRIPSPVAHLALFRKQPPTIPALCIISSSTIPVETRRHYDLDLFFFFCAKATRRSIIEKRTMSRIV